MNTTKNTILLLALLMIASQAYAENDEVAKQDNTNSIAPFDYSLHMQGTLTDQGHPSFPSSISPGMNSMKSHAENLETSDITLYTGIRYDALELYADLEMDQGFGLSDTLGVAGFPSGEAYKVGEHDPYFLLPRLFGRYTVDLGGEEQKVDDGANQVATSHTADNVTFTFGKFSVVDIFDNNIYAHDPRADFMNWSIIDMGTFDYAANAWGYTYGGAIEWNQDWWTLRSGLFDMSRLPNDKYLQRDFSQYELNLEAEERHTLFDHPGKIRALFFGNQANMGSYNDAVALGQQMGSIPNMALVRHQQFRPGGGINAEQEITSDLGAFLRAGINDGAKEAYEFTEINQTVSGGLSLKGNRWDRDDDTIGLAGSLNGISSEARQYLAAGGQGILIGDGQLPSYEGEQILEAYYKAKIITGIDLTLDYQHIANPAYDPDRGPINFYGIRLHGEI